MSKMNKKAEHAVTDAGKFPIESCRERIARQYGQNAVALSGPCEGANLCDCVCKQLQDRWSRISDRFAGDEKKVVRLAMKVAADYTKPSDTGKCVSDLEKLGYNKTAASGIADYLRAYAVDEFAHHDMDHMMDDVNNEPEHSHFDDGSDSVVQDEGLDNFGTEMGDDGMPADMGNDMAGDEMIEFNVGNEEPEMEDMNGDEGMVTIDIPAEVAEHLRDSLQNQLGGGMDTDVSVELPANDMKSEEGKEDEVPGEPADMQDNPSGQTVESSGTATAGEPSKEENHLNKAKEHIEKFIQEEQKPESHSSPEKHKHHEKKEHEGFKEVGDKLEKAKETDKSKEEKEPSEKEAASSKKTVVAQADDSQVGGKDLGNAKEKKVEDPKPLSEGNVHPEGFTAGGDKFQDGSTMKNEQKFDPKEVDKSSVSGGEKSIMGPDESFPKGGPEVPAGSAPIHGEQFEGGNTMTKGTVIATITPNGIEVTLPNGKTLCAKASINEATPEMVKAVEAVKFDGDGVKFAKDALRAARAACKAKVSIKNESVCVSSPFGSMTIKASIKTVSKDLVASIGNLQFKGDLKIFAEEVASILKKAKCLPEGDAGCTMTDTSKLEAEKFSNDGEKKAEDAPASSKAPKTKEEETKYEGGKNNPENDGKKEPEADKTAATAATTKTAAEKKVEDPKPLSEGNVHPEGYTAGGDKFQDGSTMKNEQKFDAKEVDKSSVSGGEKSVMGPDESLPKDGPKVPAGGGKIKNEEFEGGDVSTKGTTIAANEEIQKREAAAAEAKLREARLMTASVYVADLLQNGEITTAEFTETLKKYAQMPVDALQALISSTKKTRETIKAKAAVEAEKLARRAENQQRAAGLGIPVVISSSNNEKSLTERLVDNFKLTKNLNALDEMGDGRKKN